MDHVITLLTCAKSAAAALAFCLLLVGAQRPAAAAEKQTVAPQNFEQKLLDTRTSISKERQISTGSGVDGAASQIIVDVCKKNPNLPQCKF